MQNLDKRSKRLTIRRRIIHDASVALASEKLTVNYGLKVAFIGAGGYEFGIRSSLHHHRIILLTVSLGSFSKSRDRFNYNLSSKLCTNLQLAPSDALDPMG